MSRNFTRREIIKEIQSINVRSNKAAEIVRRDEALEESIKIWREYQGYLILDVTKLLSENLPTVIAQINQTMDNIHQYLISNPSLSFEQKGKLEILVTKFKKDGKLRKYLIDKISSSRVDAKSLFLFLEDIALYAMRLSTVGFQDVANCLAMFPHEIRDDEMNCPEGTRDRLEDALKYLSRFDDWRTSLISLAHERVLEQYHFNTLRVCSNDIHSKPGVVYSIGIEDLTRVHGKHFYFSIPNSLAWKNYLNYVRDLNSQLQELFWEKFGGEIRENKAALIDFLINHPIATSDGKPLKYDSLGNAYYEDDDQNIYRMSRDSDGKEFIISKPLEVESAADSEGKITKRYYYNAENEGVVTRFYVDDLLPAQEAFEQYLAIKGLPIPDCSELTDDDGVVWRNAQDLNYSGRLERAFQKAIVIKDDLDDPLFTTSLAEQEIKGEMQELQEKVFVDSRIPENMGRVISEDIDSPLIPKQIAKLIKYLPSREVVEKLVDNPQKIEAAIMALYTMSRNMSCGYGDDEADLIENKLQLLNCITELGLLPEERLSLDSNLEIIFNRGIEWLKKLEKKCGITSKESLETLRCAASDIISKDDKSEDITEEEQAEFVKNIKELGILDGVTTNPSLMAKEDQLIISESFYPLLRQVRQRIDKLETQVNKFADYNFVENLQTVIQRAQGLLVDGSSKASLQALREAASVVIDKRDRSIVIDEAQQKEFVDLIRGLGILDGEDLTITIPDEFEALLAQVRERITKLSKIVACNFIKDSELVIQRKSNLRINPIIFLQALRQNNIDLVREFFADKTNSDNLLEILKALKYDYPILATPQNVSIEMMELLLQKFDIDISGSTISVALGNNIELLRFLVRHPKNNKNIRDENGQTLLHLLASQGKVAEMELLIKEGYDINALDKSGDSPLNKAVKANKINAVKLLLREDNCVRNLSFIKIFNSSLVIKKKFLHPLTHALKAGNFAIARELLQSGSLITIYGLGLQLNDGFLFSKYSGEVNRIKILREIHKYENARSSIRRAIKAVKIKLGQNILQKTKAFFLPTDSDDKIYRQILSNLSPHLVESLIHLSKKDVADIFAKKPELFARANDSDKVGVISDIISSELIAKATANLIIKQVRNLNFDRLIIDRRQRLFLENTSNKLTSEIQNFIAKHKIENLTQERIESLTRVVKKHLVPTKFTWSFNDVVMKLYGFRSKRFYRIEEESFLKDVRSIIPTGDEQLPPKPPEHMPELVVVRRIQFVPYFLEDNETFKKLTKDFSGDYSSKIQQLTDKGLLSIAASARAGEVEQYVEIKLEDKILYAHPHLENGVRKYLILGEERGNSYPKNKTWGGFGHKDWVNQFHSFEKVDDCEPSFAKSYFSVSIINKSPLLLRDETGFAFAVEVPKSAISYSSPRNMFSIVHNEHADLAPRSLVEKYNEHNGHPADFRNIGREELEGWAKSLGLKVDPYDILDVRSKRQHNESLCSFHGNGNLIRIILPKRPFSGAYSPKTLACAQALADFFKKTGNQSEVFELDDLKGKFYPRQYFLHSTKELKSVHNVVKNIMSNNTINFFDKLATTLENVQLLKDIDEAYHYVVEKYGIKLAQHLSKLEVSDIRKATNLVVDFSIPVLPYNSKKGRDFFDDLMPYAMAKDIVLSARREAGEKKFDVITARHKKAIEKLTLELAKNIKHFIADNSAESFTSERIADVVQNISGLFRELRFGLVSLKKHYHPIEEKQVKDLMQRLFPKESLPTVVVQERPSTIRSAEIAQSCGAGSSQDKPSSNPARMAGDQRVTTVEAVVDNGAGVFPVGYR